LDEQEVHEQYDSLMTIEEASFTEKTYECIKKKHPYHAKRKPIILSTVMVTVRGQNCKAVRALGDTGASSSLIDKEFAKLVLGEDELEQQLYTQGYCPTFKTADSRYTTPCGQLRLQFEIKNQIFTHIFYVLEGCAEKIILRGCFFHTTSANIDYRTEKMLFEADGGEIVSCPFQVHKPTICSLQTAASLQSADTYSMIIEVTNSDNNLVGEFGYVTQDTANQRVTIPLSCTTLAEKTKIVVTNFSRHKFLRLRKGKQVAYFKKADRASVNIYATNLAKLGSDNAFVVADA
jgi:hypothetical protein